MKNVSVAEVLNPLNPEIFNLLMLIKNSYFLFQIAGALSCNGTNLSSMVDTCKKVLANMATLGVCTSPCALPGASKPLFKLDPNHYELGLGNHGEAGVSKINVSIPFFIYLNILLFS